MTQAQFSALFDRIKGDPQHRRFTIEQLMKGDFGQMYGPDFRRCSENDLVTALAAAEDMAMWRKTYMEFRSDW